MEKLKKEAEQTIYKRVRRRAEACATTMLAEVFKHKLENHQQRALDESDYCAIDILAGYLGQAALDAVAVANAVVKKTHDLKTTMRMMEVADMSLAKYQGAFKRFKEQAIAV